MTMFNYQTIRSLQAEISSYCNASCPQCPRNIFGGDIVPTLPLRKWRVKNLEQMFRPSFVSHLNMLYLCGTYGDPMTHPNIVEIIDWFKKYNKNLTVGIHTNGGVGKIETYQELAKTSFVSFGIDGLADTNPLYRRHTQWPKIIERSQAFIKAGGHAEWDYIVFEHNQHQVEQARTLAHTMGFKKFNVKKTGRFLNRKHRVQTELQVQDRKGRPIHKLRPPTMMQYLNQNMAKLADIKDIDNYTMTTPVSCNAQRIKEVYVAADGMVFPCGWLHDRLYGPEVESTRDHVQIKQMLASIGGWQKANCIHTELEHIVDGDWFGKIAESWHTADRLHRCGMMCGKMVNLIGEQNADIEYKT